MEKSDFITKASKIHQNKYDYSLVGKIRDKLKINIICKNCDTVFLQKAGVHLRGYGCPPCGRLKSRISRTKSKENFLIEAYQIYGSEFEYHLDSYKNSLSKINILHKKCGKTFVRQVNSHLQKHGCPFCSNNTSAIEERWLNTLGPNIERQKSIIINGKLFKVDGFDSATNTVYEFYGDYWHGNPAKYHHDDIHPKRKLSYRTIYMDTISREEELKLAGFNVISQWEFDFRKQENRAIS